MIEDINRRFAAIALTAILLATSFVVLPQDTVSAAEETNDIIILVVDSLGVVSTATVKLTDVHTGRVLNTIYDDSIPAYAAVNAPSGYYRVDISAPGYYGTKDVTGFRYEGVGEYTHPTAYFLTSFGTSRYWYNVTVKDTLGNPIQGATVAFHNRTMKQDVVSNTTAADGRTSLRIFGDAALDLVVKALGYEMSITPIASVNSDVTTDVSLAKAKIVLGQALVSGTGSIARNVVAYLYDTDETVPWQKRIMKSTGYFVRFDAYPGDFVLVVDGSNVDPYVTPLSITTDGINLGNIYMDMQNASTEIINITFNSWNSLTITTDAVWRADRVYHGLDFADIGCLRAQIDLALGNGDGEVSLSEYADFVHLVQNVHGANYVTTSELLQVNNTRYISSVPATAIMIDDFTGPVTDKANISYYSEVEYATPAGSEIDAAAPIYNAQMKVYYDSLSNSRAFNLFLADGYELVKNQTVTSRVVVTGYLNVTVDPQYSATAGSETVRLDFEQSEMPITRASVSIMENTYRKMYNESILYYVARNDTSVFFSSFGSSDPNGNPLTFIWDFGDGNSNVTKETTVKHNYTTPAENLTVTLTVRDVSGMENVTTFQMKVDGQNPRPAIEVVDHEGPLEIDQGETLLFSPLASVDDLITVGDGLGEIKQYAWTFGNDSAIIVLATEEELNKSYTFSAAGDIRVLLNVTDVVGNWANTSLTVVVNDTAPPQPKLTILNSTWGTSLTERSVLYFDASATTDNVDDLANLTFNWTFGDGSPSIEGLGTEFANVTHNYSSYGQYGMQLNVTDLSGNTATLTRNVFVGTGPRPDVIATAIIFEPKQFVEGSSGTIRVNITNHGSATATGMSIEVWYYSFDVPQKLIGNITRFYNESGEITSLPIGQSAYGELVWNPKTKGNYTIRVIVNSTDQRQTNWESAQLTVEEAAWKSTALYLGILAIFVVLVLLLVARRRMGARGGLRRPRSEKESVSRREKKRV